MRRFVRSRWSEIRTWVEAATFSPKGDLVAIACGRRVRVFGVDGSPVVESEDHPSTVTALTFGRDGKRLLNAAYGGVCVFSLAERRTIRRFEWKGSLVSLAMSPDDKVVACGSQDGSVHFWRLSTGRDSAMTWYPFKPKSLAWDSASSLLATGGDTKVTVWDFQGKGPEGTAPIQLDAHKGLVSSLAFAERRALLASGGEETAVFLWEPRKSLEPRAFGLTDDVVTSLRFGKSSLVAATAAGRVLYLRCSCRLVVYVVSRPHGSRVVVHASRVAHLPTKELQRGVSSGRVRRPCIWPGSRTAEHWR